MVTFKISKSVCNKTDQTIQRFWRGKQEGSSFSMGKKTCQPKCFEGLGFRRTTDMTLAMLAKYAIIFPSPIDLMKQIKKNGNNYGLSKSMRDIKSTNSLP